MYEATGRLPPHSLRSPTRAGCMPGDPFMCAPAPAILNAHLTPCTPWLAGRAWIRLVQAGRACRGAFRMKAQSLQPESPSNHVCFFYRRLPWRWWLPWRLHWRLPWRLPWLTITLSPNLFISKYAASAHTRTASQTHRKKPITGVEACVM